MPDALSLLDWRRTVSALYADVRSEPEPATAHARWRAGRDALFRGHAQSPLLADDPLRATGLPYWPYDPALRFEVDVAAAARQERREVPTASDGVIRMSLAGLIRIDALDITLDVWWLDQYAGGIFVPVRDGTAGRESYGGGRYLLDTAKGADLGSADTRIVVDFNFLYHPSCRYNPVWECPLAPDGNTVRLPIRGGERLDH
jgi:uncharacterized protein (DUF1684 family)